MFTNIFNIVQVSPSILNLLNLLITHKNLLRLIVKRQFLNHVFTRWCFYIFNWYSILNLLKLFLWGWWYFCFIHHRNWARTSLFIILLFFLDLYLLIHLHIIKHLLVLLAIIALASVIYLILSKRLSFTVLGSCVKGRPLQILVTQLINRGISSMLSLIHKICLAILWILVL